MSGNQKQVFLTQSPTRWQRFKWFFRIVLFIIILLTIILGIAVMKQVFIPAIPQIKNDNGEYTAILITVRPRPSKPLIRSTMDLASILLVRLRN